MIQIRQNVFETNSSSSHALVIRSKENLDYCYTDGETSYMTDEEIGEELFLNRKTHHFRLPEDCYFGRYPFRVISRLSDKVDYAVASGYEKEVEELIKKHISIFGGFSKPKDFTYGTDEPYLSTWMQKYGFTLEDFLFDKKYVVIQDGDEYCIWIEINENGLIDPAAIENYKKVE